MPRAAKIVLAVVAVVVVAGAFGAWWFVLRDDAPPPADVAALDDAAAARGTVAPSAGGDAAGGVDGVDGTWTVVEVPEAFVGYRIEELFGGDTVKKTAVGRTSAVTGTLVIDGGEVTAVDIEADLTELKSDSERRDQFIGDRGLQTDLFPSASFTLTEPIALPADLAVGQEVTATAVGELTLHGQTRPVTVEVTAKWNGSSITIDGQAPIVLSDFGIEQISLPIVTVDEQGTLELALLFEPAG